MSNAKEVRPFGIRDKVGYMFGDLANDTGGCKRHL